MRIFICAGEPSGDIHGSNLVRTLKEKDPTVECVGFGGEHMEQAGCKILYPLVNLAVMWFARVLANATTFLSLLSRADRYFRHHRPDAVVLIDYPGFNWWMARRAHFHGIPVFYFVPPQLWGWAGWRVKKMQRWVDHVLCSLPFEVAWYQERGVQAHYVGHPFYDELPRQVLDADFLNGYESNEVSNGVARHEVLRRACEQSKTAMPLQGPEDSKKLQPIVAILPGSRTQEVERNLSTLVRAAAKIHETRPDCRFLVACFRPHQQKMVDDYLRKFPSLPIETHVGRTPEIIHLAQACMAVSGSVSLELLYRLKPTVIVYRIGRLDLRVAKFFKKSRFITLVNLLAEKELFPEYLTDRCEAKQVAEHVLRWLNDPAAYQQICADLAALRHQVAESGACARTAQFILEELQRNKERTNRRVA